MLLLNEILNTSLIILENTFFFFANDYSSVEEVFTLKTTVLNRNLMCLHLIIQLELSVVGRVVQKQTIPAFSPCNSYI